MLERIPGFLYPRNIHSARVKGVSGGEEKGMPIQRSQTEEVEAPPLRVNDGLLGYLHVDSVKGASADSLFRQGCFGGYLDKPSTTPSIRQEVKNSERNTNHTEQHK